MNFGGRSSYPAETARLFTVIRAIMAPPPPRIGLNRFNDHVPLNMCIKGANTMYSYFLIFLFVSLLESKNQVILI